MVGLGSGKTGKARTDGDGGGSIASFSERHLKGTGTKGPSFSNPGPGNGSGTVPKGKNLSLKTGPA